jgi:predicted O-linked N-acetylglucosamine transferase (SPINDLY family)
VAADNREYVDIALGLAKDFSCLAATRMTLRDDLLGSGLCSSKRCAENLEECFFAMLAAANLSEKRRIA